MNIFDFTNYKDFIQKKLKDSDKKGHGQVSRIAKHLGIHTSMVSQILGGPKDFTIEQACGLCPYFGFNELESDYFVALVQWERAGTRETKQKFERDIRRLSQQSESLKDRLPKDVELTEADNALFYSQWFYTAAKLLSSISGFNTPEAIARKLGVPASHIRKALEFLLSTGLCIDDNGKIRPGPANTHLGADSPLVGRHHQNWRVKGFERMGILKPSELFLTMPATLTEKDAILIRKRLVQTIEDIVEIIDSSKGEVLYCFNLDWFDVCP